MTQRSLLKKIINTIFTLLFILTPLIAGILLCAVDGKTLSDIYIPLGGWSDEITYYKQIEGMLSHGIPRGYFGFDQSQAKYGPFGYWGILPLIPYVIWGFFFGWTYISPIYANICFCSLAFLFIYFLLKPQKKWCLSFSLFWISFQFLNRHVLSGASEATLILPLVIVVILGEYLLSDKVEKIINLDKKKENWFILICNIIVFFMTVVRPYYAVFYLVTFWAAIKRKKKREIFITPIVALMSIACFFLYKEYFCAAYFDDVILWEEMLADGIAGIFKEIAVDTIQILKFIWYSIRYKDVPGWYYLFLFVELGLMFIACITKAIKHKKIPSMYIVALVGNALIVLSIMLLYSLVVGGRHIIPLIVMNAVLLLMETHISIGWLLACIGISCSLLAGVREPLPYEEKEYAEWLDELEATFAEYMEVTDSLSYDNVVATIVSGSSKEDPNREAVTYYGYLYAVPAGMGVSLDNWDMYEDLDNIKAKYIIAHPDAKVRDQLDAKGMKCVLEMEELVLYIRE